MKRVSGLFKSGIRRTLLALVLIAALAPGLSMSIVASLTSSKALKGEADRSLLMQVKIVGEQIDTFLNDRLSYLSTSAKDPRLVSPSASERQKGLSQVATGESACSYLLDEDGAVIASIGVPEGAQITTAEYWTTVSHGSIFCGDCAMSALAGKPTVLMAAPIVSSTGRFSGALVQELDMMAIQAILDSYDAKQHAIGRTGYAYVVNKDGLVIGYPDRSQIMVLKPLELGIPELTAAVEEMVARKEGRAVYVYQGIEALVGYTPMTGKGVYKGNGWSIAAKFPTAEVYKEVGWLRNLLVGIMSVASVAAAIVGSLLVDRITRPIVVVSEVTGKVASGDLSVEVPDFGVKNEIGLLARSMKDMVRFLTEVARNVQGAAEETVAMSEELTASATETSKGMEQVTTSFQQVASGAEDQSQSASNMAEQVDNLTTAIRSVYESGQAQSRNASQLKTSVNGISGSLGGVLGAVEDLSSNAQDNVSSAATGKKATAQTVDTMSKISADTNRLAGAISDLGSRSEEIGRIVDVITDIAGQTNLLALNAAIEAARAGEYGRGFAVVADEVRKLAESSANEAKLISEEVTNIRSAIESAVKSVDMVAQEVKRGSSVVADAGSALEAISGGAARADASLAHLKSVVGHLKDAVQLALNATDAIVGAVEANAELTSKMAENAGSVRELVDNVAAISEENAASVQVAASSSEEVTASTEGIKTAAETLAKVAASLRDAISRFRI